MKLNNVQKYTTINIIQLISADYQNVPSPTSTRSKKSKNCNYKRLRMQSKCGSSQRENSHSSDLEVICERTPT